MKCVASREGALVVHCLFSQEANPKLQCSQQSEKTSWRTVVHTRSGMNAYEVCHLSEPFFQADNRRATLPNFSSSVRAVSVRKSTPDRPFVCPILCCRHLAPILVGRSGWCERYPVPQCEHDESSLVTRMMFQIVECCRVSAYEDASAYCRTRS